MKRGLKDALPEHHHDRELEVTTIAPMKRGLKGIMAGMSASVRIGYNHCPDEKGTES